MEENGEGEQNSNFKIKETNKPAETINTKEISDEKKVKIRQSEYKLVLNDTEHVGYNLEYDYILSGKLSWTTERWKKHLEENPKLKEQLDKIDNNELEERIKKFRDEEETKRNSFNDCLEQLKDKNGKLHFRIHPAGDASAVSPSQAIDIQEDGTYKVEIGSEFIEQMKTLKKNGNELDIVVPFYDHRRENKASDVPKRIDQYVDICKSLIEEIGKDIQIEIGNETNVSKETSKEFKQLQFPDKLDVEKYATDYAKFFFEVAKKIKTVSPDTKLSLAGVACFDPTYLKEVLTEIEKLKIEEGITINLVDTISFHPYRDTPESGSPEIVKGAFTGNQPIDYDDQIVEMQNIASKFNVDLNVGEINFRTDDPDQLKKLEEANSITKQKNLISFIYPGIHVP